MSTKITFCVDKDCPSRKQCQRGSKPTDKWPHSWPNSYADFNRQDGAPRCEDGWWPVAPDVDTPRLD
jgi:hypothetical protein